MRGERLCVCVCVRARASEPTARPESLLTNINDGFGECEAGEPNASTESILPNRPRPVRHCNVMNKGLGATVPNNLG